ncbi:MAG: hypothetical protein U0V49_07990 [Saprospiraceae bacterium]
MEVKQFSANIRGLVPKKDNLLVHLFENLHTQITKDPFSIDEYKLFKSYYGKRQYNASLLRVRLSQLYKLLNDFLAIKENGQEAGIFNSTSALKYYRANHHDELFSKYLSDTFEKIEALPFRNEKYFDYLYKVQLEYYYFESSRKREGPYNVSEIDLSIDSCYFIRKLKHIVRIFNLREFDKTAQDTQAFLFILSVTSQNPIFNNNAVLNFYLTLAEYYIDGEKENNFKNAMIVFFENENLFSLDEGRDNYIILVNIAIRKINLGIERYRRILFNLYERALERKYLLENNIISRFSYRNIVETALKLEKYSWADNFIIKYKQNLQPAYRNFIYSFEKSRILSEQKKFSEALSFIANISFEDVLLELACRLERVKIFIGLQDIELAEYHLKSMVSYIKRNKYFGYQQEYYLNFCKYLLKWINIQSTNKHKVMALFESIQKEEKIIDKKWLMDKCKQLILS